MPRRGHFQFDAQTISEIHRRWIAGQSKRSIARDMGISASTIQKYTAGITRTLAPTPNDGEEWHVIDGYGGRYSISSHGRLYSNGACNGRPGFIKDTDNGNGYRIAILSWNGRTRAVYLHRLVAEAFCDGRTSEKCHVNHIDGNRANNHADNFEWVTRSENMLHSANVLGHKTRPGVPSPNRKLTDDQVRAIRADGRPENAIALDYGVGHSTVSNVRLGIHYKDVI